MCITVVLTGPLIVILCSANQKIKKTHLTSINEIKAEKVKKVKLLVETKLDHNCSGSVRKFLFSDGEVVS